MMICFFASNRVFQGFAVAFPLEYGGYMAGRSLSRPRSRSGVYILFCRLCTDFGIVLVKRMTTSSSTRLGFDFIVVRLGFCGKR